jgi:hypothetical protein
VACGSDDETENKEIENRFYNAKFQGSYSKAGTTIADDLDLNMEETKQSSFA